MENQTFTTTEAAQVFTIALSTFAVRVLESLLAADEACVILAQGKKDHL